MTGWATLARERAKLLESQLPELKADGADETTLNDLRGNLADVRARLLHKPARFAWLTGNAISETWSDLHRIEERIDGLTPDGKVDELIHVAQRHAQYEMPAEQAEDVNRRLDRLVLVEDKKRAAVAAIHDAHGVAEERHESERNQQRGILYIATGLFVAAVTTIAVQAIVPAADRIIPLPTSGTTIPSWALLALVMLFGLLGGALSALFSLYITGKKLTNTLWFDPRPALSVVKVIAGAWTAVLGVLAVGTGVLVGVYTSLASVLLLAFIFGYAQQAVTRFIDRKVADIAEARTT